MMNVLSIGLKRFTALLLALVMVLSLTCVPALAEDDWQQLVMLLSWTDMWGVPGSVQAVPVENGFEHAFWAVVPAEALPNGLQLTVYHPWQIYTFTPASGEWLTDVQDCGLMMDQERVVQVMAFDGNDLADIYSLYVSTQVLPGMEIPGQQQPWPDQPQWPDAPGQPDVPVQIPDAAVTVIHRDENYAIFSQETVMLPAGTDRTFYANSYEGYDLLTSDSMTLYVDGMGNVQPSSMVEFVYRAKPVDVSVSVPVYYRTENGETLYQDSVTVSQSAPQTVYAMAFAGYELIGEQTALVAVDAYGTAWPSEVVFTYRYVPATAMLNVTYMTQDGQQLGTDVVTVTEGSPVLVDAKAYPGYVVSGSSQVAVSLGSDGVLTPAQVTFIYEPEPMATADVTVSYRTADGTVLASYVITVTEGADQYESAPAVYGNYQLAGDAAVMISVDHSGNAVPAEVVFTYEEILPTTAQVNVIYRTADGVELYREQQTVTEGVGLTVTAQAVYGNYQLVGGNTANVSVDHSGVLTPAEVVFTYEEILPATADVAVVCRTEDQQVLSQQTVTAYEDSLNPIIAPEFDGYVLISYAQINVTVSSDGTADPAAVEFVYAKLATPTPEPTSTPEPTAAPLASVVIRYVDELSGADIVEPTVKEGLPNGDFYVMPSTEDLPENYELVSEQNVALSVNGGVATPAEVVFYYQYAEPITVLPTEAPTAEPTATPAPTEIPTANVVVRYVDADTQQDVAEPDLLNGLMDGVYPVMAQPRNLLSSYVLAGDDQMLLTVLNGEPSQPEVVFEYLFVPPVTPTAEPTDVPTSAPELTTAPTAAPVFAEVVVHYLDANGKTILPDQTVVLGEGTHTLSPDLYILPDDYDPESAGTKQITVDAKGKADPKQVSFRFAMAQPEVGEMINRFGKTTIDKLFLRSEPDSSNNKNRLDQIAKRGTSVWVVEMVPGVSDTAEMWYKVLYHGKSGFIMQKYIEMTTQEETDALQQKLIKNGSTAVPMQVKETPAPVTEAPVIEVITPVPVTEAPVIEVITPVPVTEAPVIEVITPVPVTEAPVIEVITPVPVTEAPVIEIITPVPVTPTPVPVTEAPTATPIPTDVPTPTPTLVPNQYAGYALTNTLTALRDGVDPRSSSEITRLQPNTLVKVSQQLFLNGESWSHVSTLDDVSGFVPHSSLIQITDQEAQLYLQMWEIEHPTATPVPTPVHTEEVAQYQNYFMTVGDNVPFRNMPNDRSVILSLLDRNVPVFVTAQIYGTEDGWVWHYVQYGSMMGYIRSDMLRMMSEQELWNYLNSANTPAPTMQATQPPYDIHSMSSYGYVYTSNSGRVNVRQQPSVNTKQVGELRNYALCLILNKTNVSGTDWYYIDYNGLRGYVRGDLFKQLTLAEMEDFVDSDLYQQGIKNNSNIPSVSNTPTTQIVTPEQQNVTVWTDPQSGLDITYATWVPMATVAPLPTEVPTAEPTATIGFEPYTTPETAQQTMPAVTDLPQVIEPEQSGSFPFGLVGLGALGVVGIGAAYAVMLQQKNKRLAAQRSAQRAAQAQRKAQQQAAAAANTQPQNRTGSYSSNGQAQRPTPPVRKPQQTAQTNAQNNYRFAQNRPEAAQQPRPDAAMKAEQTVKQPDAPKSSATQRTPVVPPVSAVQKPVQQADGMHEPVLKQGDLAKPVEPEIPVKVDMTGSDGKDNNRAWARPDTNAAPTREVPSAAAQTTRTRRTQRNAANYDEPADDTKE